jgi:thiol-disulfide isomerase/thioredoxin
MRRLSTGLLVPAFAFLASYSAARPPEKGTGGSYAALKKEFDDAQRRWADELSAVAKAMAAAKSTEEKQEAEERRRELAATSPRARFSARFLEFAEKNPGDPSAFEALVEAVRSSGGPRGKPGTWVKAIERLRADHVAKPEIRRVLRNLALANDETADKLIRDVIAKNPDRKTQAIACKALAEGCDQAVEMVNDLIRDKSFRPRLEEARGKEYVERLLDNADKARKDSEQLKKTVRDKYADVFPDLSVGKPAPEVVSRDLEGKEARLSALKGKVVVLDIWATWCAPCREMIPHEREMVERLREKPFVLVSISADEEKKTLTDFLSREKMPWTHWWNGAEGGIVEDWEVQGFPTVYVLDARGVIRFKDLRGKKLEDAVKELVKEAEEKKP